MTTPDYVACQTWKDCNFPDVDCLYSKLANGTNKYVCYCHNNNYLTREYNCSKPPITEPPFRLTSSTIRNFPDHTAPVPFVTFAYFISISVGVLVVLTFMFRKGRKFYKNRNLKNEIQAPVDVGNIAEESNILYSKTPPPEENENTEYRTISEDSSAPRRRYTKDPTTNLVNDPPLAPILNRNNIADLEKIGEGCFGVVYKGCLRLQSPLIDDEDYFTQKVAMKTLKENSPLEAEEDFWREVEIMSSFSHRNILSLLGVCLRESDKPPCMVFEFMQYGDLAKVLRNNNRQFWGITPESPVLNRDNLLDIALQLSNGMEYLASQRYVHRDLACRNCLIGSNGLGLEVKISDFGLSRDVYINDYYRMGSHLRMLPIRWMSPESIAFGKFSVESDIWSYGVVLWEIFSYGKQPYYGYTNEEVFKKILNGSISLDIPQNCPEEVGDIMKSCWKKEPKERIRFSEICRRLSNVRENLENYSEVIADEPGNNELSFVNYDYETSTKLRSESNNGYV